MDNNKEEIKTRNIPAGEIKDGEIFSFGYLVDIILDYYCETSSAPEASESWKQGTDLEEKDGPDIPEEIDDLIRDAFKSQLKKFIK